MQLVKTQNKKIMFRIYFWILGIDLKRNQERTTNEHILKKRKEKHSNRSVPEMNLSFHNFWKIMKNYIQTTDTHTHIYIYNSSSELS